MKQRHLPTTRKSILQTGAVKPFGPHHCITYFGFVHASQTNARGASKTLVITIRSFSLTVFFAISHLRFFHLMQNHIQLVKTIFPEPPIVSCPVANCLDRFWPERAHAFSSALCLDHNARPHQVSDMF